MFSVTRLSTIDHYDDDNDNVQLIIMTMMTTMRMEEE